MSAVSQEFDWNAIRTRLAGAGKAFELADGDPGRRDEVWRERARRLARRDTGEGAASPHTSIITFRLGPEVYGLPVREAIQVAPCRHLTPVPGAHPTLLGITSLRGDALPVAGLRRILGLPEVDETPRYLVVLRRRVDPIGLAVDELDRVRSIEVDDISTPDREFMIPARFLAGLTKDFVLVLDAAVLREHPLLADEGSPGASRGDTAE